MRGSYIFSENYGGGDRSFYFQHLAPWSRYRYDSHRQIDKIDDADGTYHVYLYV